MPKVIEHRRFSLFNADGRNNKFWNITLFDDDSIEINYGPQGMPGQKRFLEPGNKKAGRRGFDRQIREKTSSHHTGGAYTENAVIEATRSPVAVKKIANHELAAKAIADIAKAQHPELTALIQYFADVNAHNIMEASGGKITYNTAAGTFSTTQGVVTLDQIQSARVLLDKIAAQRDFDSQQFKSYLNPYLSLIPQKGLVRQMDFRQMFGSAGLLRQNDILDALESSYAAVIAAAKDKPLVSVDEPSAPPMFNVALEPVDGGSEFDRIRGFYQMSKGGHTDVQVYDVRRCFRLSIQHMVDAFGRQSAGMSNVWELWHGTKASNMLSILKVGMIIPPRGSSHVTARMFGDGLYFSDQSTKSLRYATGAWGGSGAVDRKFMLLARVAMGNYHTPRGCCSSVPSGFDSCFAKAGVSGVQNNEMIVYRTSQACPTHLVELTPRGR